MKKNGQMKILIKKKRRTRVRIKKGKKNMEGETKGRDKKRVGEEKGA